MGTRSLTFVKEGAFTLVNMYRQSDGYPSGHGKELAEFLAPIKMVNGIGATDEKIANGSGCLAAQLVAHFKDGPGGIYLQPTDAKDCGQDYEYHVVADNTNDLVVEIMEVVSYDPFRRKKIFSGSVAEFAEFCAKEDA